MLRLSLKQLSQRAPAHTKRDQNRKGQRRPVFRIVKVKTGASQSQQMTVLSQMKTWTYIERKMKTTGPYRGKNNLSATKVFYMLKWKLLFLFLYCKSVFLDYQLKLYWPISIMAHTLISMPHLNVL